MPISPAEAMRQRPKTTGGAIIAIIAAALAGVYVNEGGYADHKADRGGKTMYGITEKVARQWGYRGDMRAFPKHCTAQQPVCSDLIYTTDYIERPGFMPFAEIEPAVLDELVDSGVVHGTSRPARWLQLSLNALCGAKLQADGKAGPRTIAAYRNCQTERGKVAACVKVLDRLDAAQLAYFDAIVLRRPSQRVFYRGWTTHRIGNVKRSKCGKGAA